MNRQFDHRLDELDRDLLAILRKDARRPISSLAQELSVSRATITSRIQRLIDNEVVLGFSAVVSDTTEPALVRAIMNAQVEDKAIDRVFKKLDGFPEIVAVHTTNGRWDLVLELACHSLAHFEKTIRQIYLISGVRTTETSLLLKSKWSNRTVGS